MTRLSPVVPVPTPGGGTGNQSRDGSGNRSEPMGTTLCFDPLEKFIERALAEPELTYLMPGLVPDRGRLLVVAPPNAGKTWLALAIAKSACGAGRPVFFVEEEGSRRKLGERLVSMSFPDGSNVQISHLAGLKLDALGVRKQLAAKLKGANAPVMVLDPRWCTRAEVARAASAPHVGEEGPVYPGTCRGRVEAPAGRTAAWRFRVAPGTTSVVDLVHGEVTQDVEHEVGDFLIRRNDGVASYQLAVVVDDALSGVNAVLRGDDLLGSTPRQARLQDALGFARPQWAHVPLLMQPDGKRLAKREGTWTIEGLRAGGWSAERIIGVMAKWSGFGDGSAMNAGEFAAQFSLEKMSRGATVVVPP